MFRKQLKTRFLETVSREELAKWFDPLSFRREGSVLEVGFPHELFAQWFLSAHREKFEAGVHDLLGPRCSIAYDRGLPEPDRFVRAAEKSFQEQDRGKTVSRFDTFLVNRKNYFPFASAREVAIADKVPYTPFVLCGESGTGKSFLLSLMAEHLTERGDGRVLLTTVRELDRLFDERFASLKQAEHHLAGFSSLLVDDFQDLKLFPDLHATMAAGLSRAIDEGRRLVIASRVKIACQDYLPAGLRSRLDGGLVVTVSKPDLDVRLRFLRKECRARNLSLPQDKQVLLARRFEDFRSLKGAVLKVFAFEKLVCPEDIGRELDTILSDMNDRALPELSAEHILQTVAEHFDISLEEMLSSSRKREIATARQVAMYLCRENLRHSYPRLGRIFGGKDHTSVLYSCRKIAAQQKEDPEMKRLIGTLSRKCLAQTT